MALSYGYHFRFSKKTSVVVLSLWGTASVTRGITGSCVWRVLGSGPVRASVFRKAPYAAILMVYGVGLGRAGITSQGQLMAIEGGPEALNVKRQPPQ